MTRTVPLLIPALVSMILCAASGCATKRRGEPFVGPIETPSAALQHGRTVFEQHCYRCHGNGEGGLGPSINDKPLPRFLMHFQVRHGLGTMPAFPREQIGDEDLDALLDYVVHLRRHDPA